MTESLVKELGFKVGVKGTEWDGGTGGFKQGIKENEASITEDMATNGEMKQRKMSKGRCNWVECRTAQLN